MKDSMGDFVDKLQEQIFDETRETYGEEVFFQVEESKVHGKNDKRLRRRPGYWQMRG
jgi:hypothetical protein